MSIIGILFKGKKFILRHKKVLIILLIFFSIINFSLYFYKTNVNKIINETIEVKSKALAVKAMNNAISEVVMGNVMYKDLIEIVNDDNGNIELIRANTLEINSLSKDLSIHTENYISKLGYSGIKIPIGNFTGIPLFVGFGPSVNLKVKPVGAVVCRFNSKFETAGINQTNHKIYLTINSSVSTVLPLVSTKVTAEQEVLISESIIIGKVPEVYLYSDQLDNLLNFVPF